MTTTKQTTPGALAYSAEQVQDLRRRLRDAEARCEAAERHAEALAEALAEAETELTDARAQLHRIVRDAGSQADETNKAAIAARAALSAYRAERGK